MLVMLLPRIYHRIPQKARKNSLDTFTGNVYDGVSGAAIRNTALADAIRSGDVKQSTAPDVFHVNVGDRGFAVSLMDNGGAAVVGYDLNSPAADYMLNRLFQTDLESQNIFQQFFFRNSLII